MADTRESLNKMSALFKEHDRLLTFVGAFVVFATFIVQDNLREGWKSTADSIELAESQAVLRTDLKESERVQVLFNNRATDQIAISSTDPNVDAREVIKEISSLNSSLAYLDVVDSRIQISAMMLSKIPINETAAKRLSRLSDDSRNLRGKVQDSMHARFALPTSQPDTASVGGMLVASRLATQIDDLDTDARDDYDAVRVLLDHTRQRNKTYAKIASAISSLLFVVGWGLGLTGKLVKDDLLLL